MRLRLADKGDKGAPGDWNDGSDAPLEQREPGVVFREDDEAFKERLKRNLVNHWLLNTVATLLIFTFVFYFLTKSWLVGLLGGLLVLLVSNLYNVLWKIRQFERWEIFSNGVRLGDDPQGKARFLRFSDIRGIDIRPGLISEVFVIDLGRHRLKYDYAANREVLDIVRKRYIAFMAITHPEGVKRE